MSIVDEGSVLIVGAGASADFGMPLGGDLIGMIRKQIERDFPFGERVRKGELSLQSAWQLNQPTHDSPRPEEFLNGPLRATLVAKYRHLETQRRFEAVADDIGHLFQLSDRLHNQTAETIDAFIAENPSLAELTKLAVGAVMVHAAYTWKDNMAQLKPMAARELENRKSTERNWVHLLINICRHGLPQERIVSRKVRIISFNYDPILAHVLRAQWNNTETQLWAWDQVFKIVHPHGRFPDFPENVIDNGLAELALQCGEAISVVKESNPSHSVKIAREHAAEWIREARNIYAVGFAFARPNCELLGLDRLRDHNPPNEKLESKIVFANYKGDIGVKLSAERYVASFVGKHKRVTVEEVPGMPDRKLSVSDFIKAGYLGDLPG